MKKKIRMILACLLMSLSLVVPVSGTGNLLQPAVAEAAVWKSVPAYSGNAYVTMSGNVPSFTDEQKKTTTAFETYSALDSLGRCGTAFANICPEIEPTEARGDISSVHPTGWQSNMGWERCHLIGFQLAGENANALNLITGTHYFNVTGMLPFENMIDDYVDETGNHVLYRVTPVYLGNNLVASGVQMEAYSVEDEGEGICFNIYVFNVQPGKTIDYATGIVTDESAAEPAASKVTLVNKTAVYSGKAISIGSASVTGTSGRVTYTYYTNSGCTTKTGTSSGAASSGAAPKYAGTYYVKATAAADSTHKSAVSNTAKLVIKQAYSSASLKAKTAAYTGKAISIGAASVTGSSGKVTYTYYTDSRLTAKTTSKNGAASAGGAPKKPGTYYVKGSVAADRNYTSALTKTVKLVITKGTQSISASTVSKSYKDSAVKSAAKTFSIGAKATAGKISVKRVSGSSALSVGSTGKITVKKGTKAGTYSVKVKITAGATSLYNAASAVKTITVKVTKTAVTKSTSSSSAKASASRTVYWTPSGSVYHLSRSCSSLSRSKTVYSGTIAKSGKPRACKNCS